MVTFLLGAVAYALVTPLAIADSTAAVLLDVAEIVMIFGTLVLASVGAVEVAVGIGRNAAEEQRELDLRADRRR